MILIEHGKVRHRADPWRIVGAIEAGMLGNQQIVTLRQRIKERQPLKNGSHCGIPAAAVQDPVRCGAALIGTSRTFSSLNCAAMSPTPGGPTPADRNVISLRWLGCACIELVYRNQAGRSHRSARRQPRGGDVRKPGSRRSREALAESHFFINRAADDGSYPFVTSCPAAGRTRQLYIAVSVAAVPAAVLGHIPAVLRRKRAHVCCRFPSTAVEGAGGIIRL
jgi:hypothetical protein